MQSVTVEVPLEKRAQAQLLVEFEDQLAAALRSAKAGRVDGNEVDGNTWTVFMFGKSANKLFETILPVLKVFPLSAGAKVVKRFGGPNAEEHTRRLWRGRFRITQLARKPGRRPRIGDILEFDCKGGVGHAHAIHHETSGGMRGGWVVSILKGVRQRGSWPDLHKEICRLWIPLGAATSQHFMRVVGNQSPESREMPPSFMVVSFDLIQTCVERGRSLHDHRFLDSLFGERQRGWHSGQLDAGADERRSVKDVGCP